MRKRIQDRKLVYGIGINDADYSVVTYGVTFSLEGKRKQIITWRCPFYERWRGLISRCYNVKRYRKNPTYEGCVVCDEWLYFSKFKAWMETQDWEAKHLDKDILVKGNKLYGPDTCVFVEPKVNLFFTDSAKIRGECPIGVCFNKACNKYQAACHDVISGLPKYLGLYATPDEAHDVWLAFKLEQARILAGEQTDERIAKALIERYKNYSAS